MSYDIALNFIGGGQQNEILNSSSGYCNNSTRSNFIGGGAFNIISNTITGSGYYNTVAYNFIGGGSNNQILHNTGSNCYATQLNVIAGGANNQIQTFSCNSFIVGGNSNIALGDFISMGGGCLNSASGYFSGIFTGSCNTISGYSQHDFIGSGFCNTIGINTVSNYYATFSFIGSGACNCIDVTASAYTCYAVIGGGLNNKICAGTCYSSILGGQNNIVCNNWASASGYNVTSVMDCAFHANNLIVQNIPVANTAGAWALLAAGQIYTTGITGFALCNSPLYIK